MRLLDRIERLIGSFRVPEWEGLPDFGAVEPRIPSGVSWARQAKSSRATARERRHRQAQADAVRAMKGLKQQGGRPPVSVVGVVGMAREQAKKSNKAAARARLRERMEQAGLLLATHSADGEGEVWKPDSALAAAVDESLPVARRVGSMSVFAMHPAAVARSIAEAKHTQAELDAVRPRPASRKYVSSFGSQLGRGQGAEERAAARAREGEWAHGLGSPTADRSTRRDLGNGVP